MAATFPYTHYTCSCCDVTAPASASPPNRRTSAVQPAPNDSEERTFNPHDPRANHALYPLDHLLWCDECEDVRCQRCYVEEILNWYCPSCLFEVPSSAVKSDGNRCSRNCYNCPTCTAPLSVAAMPQRSASHLKPGGTAEETYILQCQYCDWSTLDVGVQFNKPTKITEQLAKQRKTKLSAPPGTGTAGKATQYLSHDDASANLTTFYKEQLSETGDLQNPYSNSPYSSPANLARIMSLYGGLSVNALKKSREKPQPMREAREQSEGAITYSLEDGADHDVLMRSLQGQGWQDTATVEQRLSAPQNSDARLIADLWPVATLLRTRKGKRCRDCRHIISRQDPKVGNLRWKIRLLAANNIPRLSLRPLQATPQVTQPAFRLRADDPQQADVQPHVTQQYILTIRNPIFETIKVTLATPARTPGRVASRITILCPSFTVGPSGDVWDEALNTGTGNKNDGSRQAAMASLTGKSADEADRQPEAGKIWDRTRNSTSVVLEIVPGSLKPPPSIVPRSEEQLAEFELEEDDDVLEVPMFVRAEWQVDDDPDVKPLRGDARAVVDGKVQKEVAFWCVLGVGRIADA